MRAESCKVSNCWGWVFKVPGEIYPLYFCIWLNISTKIQNTMIMLQLNECFAQRREVRLFLCRRVRSLFPEVTIFKLGFKERMVVQKLENLLLFQPGERNLGDSLGRVGGGSLLFPSILSFLPPFRTCCSTSHCWCSWWEFAGWQSEEGHAVFVYQDCHNQIPQNACLTANTFS